METKPLSILKAQEDTKSIKLLWGNMTPPIHIIYPAWDSNRWKLEFEKTRDSGKILGSFFDKVSCEEIDELSKMLVSIGPLVTTGDLFALQYVLLILTNIYGSKNIFLNEAWELCENYINLSAKNKIICNNIVLIGGPSGNPIVYNLLKELGALSLFPDAQKNDLRMRIWGEKKYLYPLMNENSENDHDYGMFLYGKNPWGKEIGKDTCFYSLMGSLSWGTQGAAALCCSEEGSELLLNNTIKKDSFIKNSEWLNNIGYVKIEPKEYKETEMQAKKVLRLSSLLVPDCKFKMVWPKESNFFKNPHVIMRTGNNLKKGLWGAPIIIEYNVKPILFLLSLVSIIIGLGIIVLYIIRNQIIPASILGFSLIIPGVIFMLYARIQKKIIDKSKNRDGVIKS